MRCIWRQNAQASTSAAWRRGIWMMRGDINTPVADDPVERIETAAASETAPYGRSANSQAGATQPRRLCCRPSSARSRRCDQCFRRYAPLAVQPPSHPHREGTLPRQDVGCALARAEQFAEIGLRIAARLHPVTDRVDRIRRFDRPAPALVVLDDQCEKIKTVGLRCPGLGSFSKYRSISFSATS